MASHKKDKAIDKKSCAHCDMIENSDNNLRGCSRCKLAFYCGIECQTAHWPTHKPLCIAVKDRKPSNIETPPSESEPSSSAKCVICLETLKSSNSCTMPCLHSFHPNCVKNLRSQAASMVCPLCRTDLPPGPEQTYSEGLRLLYPLSMVLGIVSPKQQRENMVEIIKLFTCAAEEGHAEASYHLASFYHGNYGVERNPEKEFEWSMKAAKLGHANCQFNIGVFYRDGTGGVKINLKKAFDWWLKAAKQGIADAQYTIGISYKRGDGVKIDHNQAFEWCLKAAKQGHIESQHNVGVCYNEGVGIEKNDNLSFQWCLKAAKQGHSPAQLNLGTSFMTGVGVERDTKKGFQWFMKAADQGNADAQYNIGSAYAHGHGVKANYEKAFEWNLKSAKQGNASAQFSVGMSYHRGIGVKNIDKEKAREWYSKAALQGHPVAYNKLTELKKMQ